MPKIKTLYLWGQGLSRFSGKNETYPFEPDSWRYFQLLGSQKKIDCVWTVFFAWRQESILSWHVVLRIFSKGLWTKTWIEIIPNMETHCPNLTELLVLCLTLSLKPPGRPDKPTGFCCILQPGECNDTHIPLTVAHIIILTHSSKVPSSLQL